MSFPFNTKLFLLFLLLVAGIYGLSRDYTDDKPPVYGVSFSRFHSDELDLDWREAYLALLDDLKVRNFRFSAHWPITEPKEDLYDFTELDFQMENAKSRKASVIMAVGRRLPGWPECHIPPWAQRLDTAQQQARVLKLIRAVVERYKDFPNITHWQVENEPYLTMFAKEHCGSLDEEFLQKEIDLVKSLDPERPILLTDGGEFGAWFPAWRKGDAFGSTMYLYIWSPRFGKFRYPITPGFFRAKTNIVRLLAGKKEAMVIELGAEPWLLEPIIKTPIDIQLDRMGVDKFNEVLSFSRDTGFDTFYLWGAEWWYWMKLQGRPEHWDKAKELFSR